MHCYCQPVMTPKKAPSISLVKITLWTPFSKIEIKHDALFEGWWYTGRNICQIGLNWLCISTAIFKRASCFISILVIWVSTKVHKVIFTSEALGTFFWFQHSFATVVYRVGEILPFLYCVLYRKIGLCSYLSTLNKHFGLETSKPFSP